MLLIAGIVLLGGLLRYWGSLGDLWLDEIHSLQLILGLTSASETFTALHGDGNHYLNSLFLYLLGWQEDWTVYRSLSLVTGLAAVLMGSLIGWRRGPLTAVTCTLLLSFSFPLIVYSSEARGYAPAIFFALVAYFALRQILDEGGRGFVVLYWSASVLGFVSHLSFAHFFLAGLLWSAWRLRPGRTLLACAVRFAEIQLVPLACLAVLSALSIAPMQIAGGPWIGIARTLAQVCALALGIPHQAPWIAAAVLACVVLAVLGLLALRRSGSDEWILYAGTLLLVPGLLMIARPPGTIFPRYFLIPLVFFLLLMGHLLADWAGRGRAGRLAWIGVMLAVLIGNGVETARFLERSRGHYMDGLTYMVEQSVGAEVSVGSDHPYRNPMVLAFYSRHLPDGAQVTYFGERYLPIGNQIVLSDGNDWPADGTEWFVVHSFEREPVPSETLEVRGVEYELARSFGYYGLSGWHWILYHRLGSG
ncbi:MAG: hypothetical protein ABFS14_04850 [Gemmatimonadota bacterium]